MSTPARTVRRTLLRGAVAAFVAGLLALVPVTSASAHDYLVDSSPKADSVQTEPLHTVTLTFNDRILDLSGDGSSALMQVTGPDALTRHYETACPTILDRTLSVPVSLGRNGKYTVTWQIVSADGHTVSNSLAFSYEPAAGTVASNGTDSGPRCGRTESTSAPSAGAGGGSGGGSSGDATAQSSDLGLVLGIAIGIVVLALAGVLVIVVTARRRPAPDGTAGSAGPAGSAPDQAPKE